MKTLRLLLSLFLPGVLLAQSAAPSAPESREAAVERLLEVSGMKRHLESFNEQAPELLEQLGLELQENQRNVLLEAWADAYQDSLLVASATGHFLDNYDPERIEGVLRWFEQPDNAERKARREEIAEEHSGALDSLAAAYWSAHPPDTARIAWLDRYIEAARSVRYTSDLAALVMTSVMAGGSLLRGEPIPEGKLETMVFQMRMQLVPAMKEVLRPRYYYVQREDSEGGLREELAFYESELGQWYAEGYTEAQRRALNGAKDRFLRNVRESLSGE